MSGNQQEENPVTEEVRYQVDGNGILVAFNAAWDAFAVANDTPGLTAANIAGHPLRDFITNPEVRHVHDMLLKRVRAAHRPIALPFRCDAPALRRFMEMDIVELPNGNIEYRCRVLRTEAREPVPVHGGADHGDGVFVRICSWCNRIEVKPGLWLEIEEAIVDRGLFDATDPPPFSHTLCDNCLASLEKDDDNRG